MYDRRALPTAAAILSLIPSVLLTACSGRIVTAAPITPVFTSTPGTQAVEASPYTYQPAVTGSGVSLSLTNGPAGATFGGNTISWTPTAQQSRIPNNFTLTATAPGGASATQSWTVTPAGTIRISWVDTLWNENGSSTTKPFDWGPVSSFVAALVPQPDGSFQSFSGNVGVNGEFDIPNVPAGYYWLRIAPRATYWTSSSTFDMGRDTFAPVTNPTASTSSTTSFSFNFTSLEPTTSSGVLQLDSPEGALGYAGSTNAGSTTFFGGYSVGSNLNFSVVKNAFVRQYEPIVLGSVDGYVLGPELTLSNLSLTTGAQNTISGALNPTVPASIQLSIAGSEWAHLSDQISPFTPTATAGGFFFSVQPYTVVDSSYATGPIHLIWTKPSNGPLGFVSGTCSLNPPFTTDIQAGTVQYSDPFPTDWRRTFSVCQTAAVPVPVPGTTQTQKIILSNNQTTLPLTTTVKPLLSAVLNPKINGADLFTPTTVSSTAVTLSWDPPAIGRPFGYQVAIMAVTALPLGTVSYISAGTLSTAKTSLTIPPGFLAPGRSYLFVITSLADARANMETSPNRSSLPTANADLISAAITTN